MRIFLIDKIFCYRKGDIKPLEGSLHQGHFTKVKHILSSNEVVKY